MSPNIKNDFRQETSCLLCQPFCDKHHKIMSDTVDTDKLLLLSTIMYQKGNVNKR